MNDDMSSAPPPLTYPGGFDEVVARLNSRRDALSFAKGEALPPVDVDLGPLKTALLERPKKSPRARDRSGHMRKWLELLDDFEGQPELLHLHGLLIAHLRKDDQPAHTMALFTRLWAEEHAWLIAHLDPRWLVSAVTTFGDHGQTEVQRRVGSAMTVLFGTMKLYESERLYSGLAPEQEFKLKRHVARKLPLNMDRYALVSGGLDVNMLGRLWVDAEGDTVLAPLVHHLLNLVNRDPGTVFRRFATLRGRKQRQRSAKTSGESEDSAPAAKPAKPTWGVVATIKADATTLRRFAEHHLALGAQHITVYLDAPLDRGLDIDGLTLIACDDAYWAAQKIPRPEKHQQRQAFNATKSYRAARIDWLAHIDVDEFLHGDVAAAITAADAKTQALIVPPAEEIASEGAMLMFRRMYLDIPCDKSVLSALYPTFGHHLRSGFISHTQGKTIARTGLSGNIRFGLHLLKKDGAEITTVQRSKTLTLLHRHAPDWPTFRAHLHYRLSHGSYRKRDAKRLGMGEIVDAILAEDGEAGLRAFYDEICTADTDKLALMRRHDMLIETQLLRLKEPADA